MANEQDFKKLLETQKETNKQLALLRQEQMQIAKDPPEKFLEGEEFKATALHIASEKLSGMHETDDEVKKLREIFQGATEKSEKISEENLQTNQQTNDKFKTYLEGEFKQGILQGKTAGDIVRDPTSGLPAMIKELEKIDKTLITNLDTSTLNYEKQIKFFQEESKLAKQRELALKEVEDNPKKLLKLFETKLFKGTMTEKEKSDTLSASADKEREKKEKSFSNRLLKSFSLKNIVGSLTGALKKIGGAAGLGIKAILGTLITAGVLIGLGSLLINFEKIIDNMKKTEEGIENFKEKTGEVADALTVGIVGAALLKLTGLTAGAPLVLLAAAIGTVTFGIIQLAKGLQQLDIELIKDQETLSKEMEKARKMPGGSAKIKRIRDLEKRAEELGLDPTLRSDAITIPLDKPLSEKDKKAKEFLEGFGFGQNVIERDGKFFAEQVTPIKEETFDKQRLPFRRTGGMRGERPDKVKREFVEITEDDARLLVGQITDNMLPPMPKKQERENQKQVEESRRQTENLITEQAKSGGESNVVVSTNVDQSNKSNNTTNHVTSKHITPLDGFFVQSSMMEF